MTLLSSTQDGIGTTILSLDPFTGIVGSNNQCPTISPIPPQKTRVNTPTQPISFTFGDQETPVNGLTSTLVASSWNERLIPTRNLNPSTNILVQGTQATGTWTIMPAPGESGIAWILVTVTDADGCTQGELFSITVESNDDLLPTLSISDSAVTERNAGIVNAVFTVVLSPVSGNTVTVNYATANDTAAVGSDFVAASGKLIFSPGETQKTIVVEVQGDTIPEADETFFVNLSDPVNAILSDGQGMGFITDDDALPTIAIHDAAVTEGDAGTINAVFNVTLSTVSGQVVTVDFATADDTATAASDYRSVSSTLTFNPGETNKSILVPIIGDLSSEPAETFFVNLTRATNAVLADSQGKGTITDNDSLPRLSINNFSVAEGNTGTTNAVLTVSLSAAGALPVSVNWATANGTASAASDYLANAGTLTFAAGQTTSTISIVVNGDTINEADEIFFVNLSNGINATISDGQGVVTISNDDALSQLTINDITLAEGNSGATDAILSVSLSAPSAVPVSVDWATANGTASAPGDYLANSGTLTFAPGQTTRTISIVVNGDTFDETDETFFVNLSNAANASISDDQGVVTILDDDQPPSVLVTDAVVSEGNSGTTTNLVFQVRLSTASGKIVSVDYATANGTATAGNDYQSANGTLTFPPGTILQTVTVRVNGDDVVEPDETVLVNLSNVSNATIGRGQGVGKILNDEELPSLTVTDASVTEGNSGTTNAVFTVLLSIASSQTVTVDFTTADGTAVAGSDYIAISRIITFPPGTTTTNVSVQVIGDTAQEPDEIFSVRLTNAVNATIARGQGQGAIRNDDNQAVFPPRIIVQPQSQEVFVAATVIFTVQASGSQPLIYQWSFNGVNIPGATTNTLTISQAQLTDSGSYAVVVSNAFGSDTSLPAILAVTKWKFGTGNYIRSSPALASDGTVYFGSADAKFYALDPTGKKKWEFATGSSIESSPAIGADGTIYFGSLDSKLYALNPDGTQKWSFLTGDLVTTSPAVGANGTIYFGSVDQKLYALNPDGSKQWDFTTASGVYSSPAIGADGAIYFGSYDNKLYALNTNGTKRWEFTTAGVIFSSPTIGTDGVVYCGSEDGKLYAINTNGTERWKFTTGAEVISSPAIGSDGTIYVGSFDHNVYAFNPDGTKRWQFLTGDAVFSSPAIGADGTIYVGSLDSGLYAINPDGTKRWEVIVGDGIESSPAIGPDGTIYFGSYDHYLHSVPGDSPLANTPWAMFRHDLHHTGQVPRLAGPGLLAPKQFSGSASVAVGRGAMLGNVNTGYEQRTANGSGQAGGYADVAAGGNLSGEIKRRPGLVVFAQSDGTIQLQLNGEPGSHYLVQTSTNLVEWITSFDLVSTQAKSFFRDSTGTNAFQRFYRVISVGRQADSIQVPIDSPALP